MYVARKKEQKQFFAAHAIGNRQHDDEQNERGLGTNLTQLNENENGWKGGLLYLKNDFFNKKLNCQPENIITYNVISFFKTLKVGRKPVVVLVKRPYSLTTFLVFYPYFFWFVSLNQTLVWY